MNKPELYCRLALAFVTVLAVVTYLAILDWNDQRKNGGDEQ
jgi:hypothetical protein